MKKFLRVVAGLAAASLLVAGCSSSTGAAKQTKTLELWTAWTEGADTANASTTMIKKFEQDTGYTVHQTNFTYDMLHDKLIASAAGKNLPDVVWGLPEYVGEFAKMGILADLTSAWSSWSDASKVSDSVKQAMSFDGKVVGFPYETTVRAYLVHDNLLSKAGVTAPTTWDGVVAMGSKVQDATGVSAYGVAGTGVRSPQELMVYLAQEGLAVADKTGNGYKNTWKDDPAKLKKAAEVFQFYVDALKSGAVSSNSPTYGWEQTDENFATGLTATYVTGNWLAERETTNKDTMSDISVHPIPYPSDGHPATYLESKPMFVMATSKNLDGATKLSEAFASTEWQKAAFPDRSALKDVSTDSKWSKDFHALMDTGVTFPPVTLSGVTQGMIDALARVLQQHETPEATAGWLSDQINASLEKSGDLATS